MTSLAGGAAVSDVSRDSFPMPPPARSTLAIEAIEDALFEIEALAYVSNAAPS